jgi:hypothetical protein
MINGMRKPIETLVHSPEQQEYVREIQRRERRARWSTRSRYLAIHLSWIVVLLAGAGVPLAEALGSPAWLPPVLGFVVVAFQGFERIFGRTSAGSRSMDRLRRGLAREERLLLAGVGAYADETTRADVFVGECEKLLLVNDEEMVDYFAGLTDDQSG